MLEMLPTNAQNNTNKQNHFFSYQIRNETGIMTYNKQYKKIFWYVINPFDIIKKQLDHSHNKEVYYKKWYVNQKIQKSVEGS